MNKVCRHCIIVTALVLKVTKAEWGTTLLLTSYHLSAVEKSPFADIISKAAWSQHN